MYKIIAIYDSLKHFEIPVKEYQKRLGKDLEIIQLKPSKKDTKDLIKEEETKRISDALKKESGCKVLLDIGGKISSTEHFVEFLEKRKSKQGKIIFIIGGVYGVKKKIHEEVDDVFSLSLLTFPHNLALLTLLEQIYRVESIKSGKNYHY